MMKRPRFLPAPTVVAVIVVLFVRFPPTESTASAAEIGRRYPGFVYTRNRGRCTPQYWSSTRESWPRMIPQGSTVTKVFGSRAYERYRYDLTLLEATLTDDDNENVFMRLAKESTAALLNSYARQGFPFSAWEVKTSLIQGLVSEHAAAVQAQRFYHANQACN